MEPIMEAYERIYQGLKRFEDRITTAQAAIADIEAQRVGDVPARIEKLREQLEKIDDYLLKIEAFRQLAEKYMVSQNVLTIEAPPDYRVNLNRLRQWAMLIDPTSSDDPYAQRVYVTAQCDLCFLRKKQAEFTQRIEELSQDKNVGFGEEIRRLQEDIQAATAECRDFYATEEMASFAREVEAANYQHWHETAPATFVPPQTPASTISPGAYAAQMFVPQDLKGEIKGRFGRFYDDASSRILLPVELPTDQEFAMSIVCVPSRAKQLDRGIQNLLLNLISVYPAGQNTIYVLDAVRFSSASLGGLRRLEGSFALPPIPRNPDQLTATLEQIVATFPDMDDALELCDSVVEYNQTAEPEKRLPRTTLILYGWPDAVEGRDKEYLQRIMTNSERYGISFICVTYQNDQRKEDNLLPGYAMQNAIQIRMQPKTTTIQVGDDAARKFTWYTFTDVLSDSYVAEVQAQKVERSTQGNEYPKRYDCVHMPAYTRDYKKIELPFGVDSKDQAHSVSFENENFAAYLVGASRSGKSTLLHTLIAGIIRNYHPDNVELWLADFKQLEFKKYMDHCPPHVKYILLDESTELVYDLIDKLTGKMMERQRLFARLGKERLDQIDPTTLDEPVPVIFVILDEFSIMSQAIAESETYKLKLQNLLAKGAALGIKFLFSSQTFTTGVRGLTDTARAQIQQRIAMKGTRDEISATLELSANLKTEQVRNWMDALPPHYALVKYRISADQLPQVMRTLVMYIPDYAVRDQLIETIHENMTPVERYDPISVNTYVDKHPVMVDGNTFASFPAKEFEELLRLTRKENLEDRIVVLGVPRLMSPVMPIAITSETRENLLLIARGAEQSCAASVVTSAMRSFLAQNSRVEVWAYGKNNVYKMCRDEGWKAPEFELVSYQIDIDAVCDRIRELKAKIMAREAEPSLIVLAGIDRICADFDFVDGMEHGEATANTLEELEEEAKRASTQRRQEAERAGATVASAKDECMRLFAVHWPRRKEEIQIQMRGEPAEQVNQALQLAYDQMVETIKEEVSHMNFERGPAREKQEGEEKKAKKKTETGEKGGAYDARQDFLYIVKQGSRLGYHFLLLLNDYADLRPTGLKLEWFRHRMSFQISADDSRDIFGTKIASGLPEHICQYSDALSQHSFRPYLHRGIVWDGWMVDENGDGVNPFVSAAN